MMIVVDASVAVKWFIQEDHTAEAERLLDGSFSLGVPELIYPEFGGILWKKARRGETTIAESRKIVDAFRKMKLRPFSHSPLLKASYVGAEITGQTVYDWMYLALAVSLSCEFVTADERFYKALYQTSLRKHLRWIEDL